MKLKIHYVKGSYQRSEKDFGELFDVLFEIIKDVYGYKIVGKWFEIFLNEKVINPTGPRRSPRIVLSAEHVIKIEEIHE